MFELWTFWKKGSSFEVTLFVQITTYVFYFRPSMAENEQKLRTYRPLWIILSNLNGLFMWSLMKICCLWWKGNIKFRYCEKTIKLAKRYHTFFEITGASKQNKNFFQIFVALSKYLNFNHVIFLQNEKFHGQDQHSGHYSSRRHMFCLFLSKDNHLWSHGKIS